MSTPEGIQESEQAAKAHQWLSDARAHIKNDPLATLEEKLEYLRYLAAAEEMGVVVPQFEAEIARLQDGRETSSLDIFGLQVATLPAAMRQYAEDFRAAIGA